MKHSKIFRYLFFVYVAVVAGLSVMPAGESAGISDIVVADLLRLDYLLHALVFIPLVPLWQSARPGDPWWMVIGGGLLFGACCEGLHFLLPYRSYNINDLMGNMAGVLLGAFPAVFIAGCLRRGDM